MKTLLISEFKTHCIAEIGEACRTGEPILVTRRGKPIARVEPIVEEKPVRILGGQRGAMKIEGDIVHTDFSDDWEMDR